MDWREVHQVLDLNCNEISYHFKKKLSSRVKLLVFVWHPPETCQSQNQNQMDRTWKFRKNNLFGMKNCQKSIHFYFQVAQQPLPLPPPPPPPRCSHNQYGQYDMGLSFNHNADYIDDQCDSLRSRPFACFLAFWHTSPHCLSELVSKENIPILILPFIIYKCL